jgi:hypothetical protein
VLSGVYVSGPASSVQSSPATFLASVVGLGPTGTVQFRDGFAGAYSNLGTPSLLAASNPAVANASITTSSLAPGSHSIAASYSGDALNVAAATEIPKLHVVLAQPQVVLEMPASSLSGTEVALAATVAGRDPTGVVQFMDGAAPLGPPVALIQGVATLRIPIVPTGNHSITASYAGDGQNAPGVSPARSHVVSDALATRVSISSSANPATFGAGITISVAVTGNGTPTGSVTLRDLGMNLGDRALSSGGATFSLGSLSGGVHRLTADYSGDGSNTAATSDTLFQEVAVPAPAFLGIAASTSGAGSGSVTSNPPGLDCGATCSAGFLSGSTVTLTATPSGGSVFVGWIGACSGTGTCTIAMTDARSAGARFELPGAGVTILPASLAFGGQSMNTTAPSRTVTLTNNSGAPVHVTSVEAALGFGATHDCVNVANGATCAIVVAYTPNAQGAAAANVALLFSQGGSTRVSVIPVTGTGERSLSTHYYRAILRRDPDAPGKAFWDAEAVRMQSMGANVNEAWFAMAQFFFFGAEYATFNRDNAGFVTDLYRTFFNRDPDSGGLGFWVSQIGSGMPREVVLASFMFSTEFSSFAQAIFGNTTARAEVDVVMDFYRGLLARLPDPDGFTAWVNNFRTAQCAGTGVAVVDMVEAISAGFVGSGEYTGKNRTNAQYVGDLYNAFLRRGGDLGGVQFWINDLNSGARTRENVRQNFVASAEFQARVGAIVNQGCLP